jgi:hypothetical protein
MRLSQIDIEIDPLTLLGDFEFLIVPDVFEIGAEQRPQLHPNPTAEWFRSWD